MPGGECDLQFALHGASWVHLTSLEFIASSENPVDDSYDETEDETGEAGEAGEEEHQWTQHDGALPPKKQSRR